MAGDLASLVIRTSYAAITRVMQAVYVHIALLAFLLVVDAALSGGSFTSNDIFTAGRLIDERRL